MAAPILMDGMNARFRITGQQISSWDLPEFARDVITEDVPLRGGVGELEAALREADEGIVRIGLGGFSELVNIINRTNKNPYQTVERIYWGVSTTSIHGVLDRIRTALTVLVAELRSGTPDDAAMPSEQVATQAVQFIVTGERNRVVVNNAQASGEATSRVGQEEEPEPPGWKRRARFLTAVGVLAAIVGTVAAVLQYLAT